MQFIVCVVAIVSTVSNAQWTVYPIELPRKAMYMAVGAYHNSIYLIGGDHITLENERQLIQYNIITNTLIDNGTLALSADVYVISQGYTQINNILYVIAGSPSGGKSLKIFDMNTLQLTYNWGNIEIPMDVRDRACLASTYTHLFVMGGGYNSGILHDIQMLEISTQLWRNDTPSMIKPRAWFSCIVEPNTLDLYAIGGGSYYTSWKSIEKIQTNNIEQHVWEFIPGEFAGSAYYTRAVAYNGYIFVVGGAKNDAGWQYIVDVHVINPLNGSMSVLADKLVYGVYCTAAIVVENIIYAIGGGITMNTNTVKTWMTYNLSTTLYGATVLPTTLLPTSAQPSTSIPTTAHPTTVLPTSAQPTTSLPTTAHPSTSIPTTSLPTTIHPSTSIPTTAHPTTSVPTTTTLDPTTSTPTTIAPTTSNPTTIAPTTSNPTTSNPTTSNPTTSTPTTSNPTTSAPTTSNPTTSTPTTLSPTTSNPTTSNPTTSNPTTSTPTTIAPTTFNPTTSTPTSAAPSTAMPTFSTAASTSLPPTTSNTELIQLILGGDFDVLVTYLTTNGITLPDFALNTIETLMKKSKNPNLDKVIVNIINVHSGSIVIEYSLSSNEMYLLYEAIGNIDNDVGSNYKFNDFTFSVVANKITIIETNQTINIEDVEESSTYQTSTSHHTIVMFIIIMVLF